MNVFPSPLERTVASALLLLSTTTSLSSPPSPPSKLAVDGEIKYVKEQSAGKSSSEESLSWMSSGSKTCVSSVASDVSSFKEIRPHKHIFAVASRCHETQIKVARKKRSQVNWSSDQKKKAAVLALPTSEEASTESGSCLSSTSSVESSARSQYMKMKEACHVKPKRSKSRSGSSSDSIRRRAEAILYLLAGGCFSELRIRELLGDSPDTSKALRMLLKQEEVRRYGTGGRHDPYIYTVVTAGDSKISYSRETTPIYLHDSR